MRALLMAVCAMTPLIATAQVYKCTGVDGKVEFSDRPCAGATTKQEAVTIDQPPAKPAGPSKAEQDAQWEEAKRFRYVEVPALERQAAELMASGDPQRQKLGQDMAWEAHKAKEAFMQLERARASREEINQRYDRLRRDLRGY